MPVLPPSASRILGLLLLCAFAPGCSALNLKQPTASLRGANVANVTVQGLAANFDLNVENPNSVSLPISGASYKVSFSGVPVVDDQAKPDGTLPANGTLPVTLPVHLTFDQLVKAEQAIARSGGNVPFEFDGGLEFSSGKLAFMGPLKVPLHFSGTLNFRQAIEEAIRDPRTLLELAQNPSAKRVFSAILGRQVGL